jgi:hypothetical protein
MAMPVLAVLAKEGPALLETAIVGRGRMRGAQMLSTVAGLLRRYWRLLVGLALAGAAIHTAMTISDAQGRADLPRGYAVRMTCETDPESYLWSGGCDRVADDIARTDKPSFLELYLAFVTAHHKRIPSPATIRRFSGVPCEPGFDVGKSIQGTRFVLEPQRFVGVCTPAHAAAIKEQMDARDRALLTIERAGLSWSALAAGTLANLAEPLVLLGGAAVFLALWIL